MHIPKQVQTIQEKTPDHVTWRKPPSGFPACGEDKVYTFITGIISTALFDWFDLNVGKSTIHFQKYIFPVAASEPENDRKYYAPGFPLYALTEKQAAFIEALLRKRVKQIPSRQNFNFSPDRDEPEFWAPLEVKIWDHVVFQKLQDFNPVSQYYSSMVEPDEGEKASEALYKQQGKSKSKK